MLVILSASERLTLAMVASLAVKSVMRLVKFVSDSVRCSVVLTPEVVEFKICSISLAISSGSTTTGGGGGVVVGGNVVGGGNVVVRGGVVSDNVVVCGGVVGAIVVGIGVANDMGVVVAERGVVVGVEVTRVVCPSSSLLGMEGSNTPKPTPAR